MEGFATVVVSPKFQIVLPKAIRELLGLRPGRELVVVERRGQIVLIPVKGIKEMRGFAKGISVKGLRDETDRF